MLLKLSDSNSVVKKLLQNMHSLVCLSFLFSSYHLYRTDGQPV